MEVIFSADEAFIPLRDMAQRVLSAVCGLMWQAQRDPEQRDPGLRGWTVGAGRAGQLGSRDMRMVCWV